MRHHTSPVYTIVMSLSVCLPQVGVLLKRINVGSSKQCPRDSSFLMPKILAKLKRGHPQRRHQMQAEKVKIGNYLRITRYNSKTSAITSIVNLVQSQVCHTEHPPLFAARLPWCSVLHGFVSDGWYLYWVLAWQTWHIVSYVRSVRSQFVNKTWRETVSIFVGCYREWYTDTHNHFAPIIHRIIGANA